MPWGLLLVIFAGVLAPLESLGWWAGWSGKEPQLDLSDIEAPAEPSVEPQPEKDFYLVYLSGIGVASAEGLASDEIDFLNTLTEIMPDAQIITDVFPYSVNNNPLTGERFLSPLWNKVRAIQAKDS